MGGALCCEASNQVSQRPPASGGEINLRREKTMNGGNKVEVANLKQVVVTMMNNRIWLEEE